jgi:hypothetical protein
MTPHATPLFAVAGAFWPKAENAVSAVSAVSMMFFLFT